MDVVWTVNTAALHGKLNNIVRKRTTERDQRFHINYESWDKQKTTSYAIINKKF